ncbi:hypothetical protein [Cohnella panacarvi]|uniref:hypothetical protein n=1 Tax=Cohnella panacarvi TaxID=400776 RepID=UPI00047AADBD|nr:hypothetical protein [Cohnella panacarvi]
MIGEEVLTDPTEMGMIVETAIYKHVHSFNYLNTTQIGYYRDSKTEKSKVASAIVITKNSIRMVNWNRDPASWFATASGAMRSRAAATSSKLMLILAKSNTAESSSYGD